MYARGYKISCVAYSCFSKSFHMNPYQTCVSSLSYLPVPSWCFGYHKASPRALGTYFYTADSKSGCLKTDGNVLPCYQRKKTLKLNLFRLWHLSADPQDKFYKPISEDINQATKPHALASRHTVIFTKTFSHCMLHRKRFPPPLSLRNLLPLYLVTSPLFHSSFAQFF